MIRTAFRLILLCIPTLGILAILGGILLTIFDSGLPWMVRGFIVFVLASAAAILSMAIFPEWGDFVRDITGRGRYSAEDWSGVDRSVGRVGSRKTFRDL